MTVSPKCHTGEEAESEGRNRKGIKIVEDQEKERASEDPSAAAASVRQIAQDC